MNRSLACTNQDVSTNWCPGPSFRCGGGRTWPWLL